jgi:hypothetical protein
LLGLSAKNNAPGCSIKVVLEIGIHLPSFETAKNGLFEHPLLVTTVIQENLQLARAN